MPEDKPKRQLTARPRKELAKGSELPTPMHCNGHVFAAIDTETTGLQAGYNDLVQVAIVILDHNFKRNESIAPFYTDLKPLRPENVDPKAMQVNKLRLADLINNGLDPWSAGESFIEWFEALGLAEGKKIIPLGHSYEFDKSFLIEWLGAKNYDNMFHYDVRDIKRVVAFLNDKTWWKADIIKYPKTNLQYVASQLGIKSDGEAHDALADAMLTAEVYRKLLSGVPI